MDKDIRINADTGNTESLRNDQANAQAGTVDRVEAKIDEQKLRAMLACVTSKQQLEAVFELFSYDVKGLQLVRTNMPAEGLERGQILDLAAQILVDSWESDREKAGKMATFLSQTWVGWHPEDMTIIDKLLDLCKETIGKGDTTMVAVVQPTIFVLANLGREKEYARWLNTTTREKKWREADLNRNVGTYYASGKGQGFENQLNATVRHLTDPNRAGRPTRAHDVGLLVEICERLNAQGRGKDDLEFDQARDLLRQTIQVLEEHMEGELADYVRQYV